MTKAMFLGITRIEKTPSITLDEDGEVTGEARIIDSLGTAVTVCFYDTNRRHMDLPLGVLNGGDFDLDEYDNEDGEAYIEGDHVLFLDDMRQVEEWIATSIDRIEHAATLAAEDAWNQVWIDAASHAEHVAESV